MRNVDEPSGSFEERYKGLFLASRDAIMTVEPPSWKFTSANPACLEMFGIKDEKEFLACEPWALSPKSQPDGRRSVDKAKEMIEKAVREGSSQFEWVHKRLNGEEFFADVLLSRLELKGRVIVHAVVRDISQRKKMEKDLLEASEFRYRALVETALEGVWFLDKDFKTTEVNDSIVRMLGYSLEEIIGRPFMDFIFEEDVEEQSGEFERRKAGASGYYERRVRCKDGSAKWFLLSARPLKDASGVFTGTFALFTDITERKRIEDELKRSEAKFRMFFNKAAESMLIIALDGNILEVNDVAVKRYGYSREEFLTMTVMELDAPDIPTELENRMKTIEEQGYSVFERVQIKKDGIKIPVEVSCSPIEYAGQRAVLAIIRDIADRKAMEETIRRSEERFRAIFNSTFQFTGLLTPDGSVIEINQSALDFAGLKLADVIGKLFWESRWWAGNEVRVGQLKDAVKKAASGEFVRYEVELQGVGDKVSCIDFSLKPILDDVGKVILLVPEGRDITDIKKTTEELRDKVEKLELFNNVMMDREDRIISLKKEVEELKEKLKTKNNA